MSYNIDITDVTTNALTGRRLIIPVKVDWPELRLTESQRITNALCESVGKDPIFPDRSFITVTLDMGNVVPVMLMDRDEIMWQGRYYRPTTGP